MARNRNCLGVVIAASLLLAGTFAPAQAPAPAEPTSTAADVLKCVPSGCMGFVVVPNVQDLTGKIDGFIKQISPEGQPMLPGSVLDMIKGAAGLAEGFDANGSFAMVMLDPQQYGLDLVSLISGATTQPVNGENVPLVFVIPGTDPAKMFQAHQPVKDGEDYKLVGMGDSPGWARQMGKHVLLSPCRKALAAVATTQKSVAPDLSAAEKALMGRNQAMAWLNFKVVAPILDAAIARMEKEAAEIRKATEGQEPGLVRPDEFMKLTMANALSQYRMLVKQVDGVALGLRFVESGIFIEARGAMRPDSAMGQALAATKHVASPLLNRLPNMPYILAIGAQSAGKLPPDEQAKQIDKMLAGEPFRSLSDETKAKLRKIALASEEQVQSTQLFAGVNTAGGGRLGVACVLECKSADKVREILAEAADVAADVMKIHPMTELRQLSVKYQKGLDSLGAMKLDVISIEHPDLEEMPEEGAAALKVVLGEQKIRLYVAQPNPKTLVITLGGQKQFLASAIQASAGTGKLEQDPAVAKVLAMMPKERVAVVVFSLRNMVNLVMDAVKDVGAATGNQPPPIDIKIESTTPFAVVMSIEKTDLSLTGYVPTAPIREVVRAITSAMMPQGPPPDDF